MNIYKINGKRYSSRQIIEVLTKENEKLKAELELLKMKPKMTKSEFQSDAYEQYCKEYDEHKAELEAKAGRCRC